MAYVAQRRPGRERRRHQSLHRSPRAPHALNEGRGANPGDTTPRCPGCRARAPLNEGRGANPGDTWPARPQRRACNSLNEGRGANPGDTLRARLDVNGSPDAQRRPGRKPRRHPLSCALGAHRCGRSTKAGARTPATPYQPPPGRRCKARSTKAGARTPATPRLGVGERPRGVLPRSTKAGAQTPATRRPAYGRRDVHRRRSTKAGARTPATPHSAGGSHFTLDSLNEGRGANPGDTACRRPSR